MLTPTPLFAACSRYSERPKQIQVQVDKIAKIADKTVDLNTGTGLGTTHMHFCARVRSLRGFLLPGSLPSQSIYANMTILSSACHNSVRASYVPPLHSPLRSQASAGNHCIKTYPRTSACTTVATISPEAHGTLSAVQTELQAIQKDIRRHAPTHDNKNDISKSMKV